MPIVFIRDASSEGGPGNPSIATAFAVVQLTGLILLIIIFTTAVFARSVKRSPPWISLFVGWILSSISYNLLFFARQQTGPDPSFGLCVVQGALIHSVPILQSGTVLSLMIHAWMFVYMEVSQKGLSRRYQLATTMLIIGHPYVLALSIFAGFFLVCAIQAPWQGIPLAFTAIYFTTEYHRSTVTAVAGGFLMLVALVFQVMLGFLLYKNWGNLRRRAIPMAVTIRVLVFTSAGILVLGTAIVYITAKDTTGFNWVLSSMPFLAAFIFGTQMDLLRVWMFWRVRPGTLTTIALTSTTQDQAKSASDSFSPALLA